MKIAIIDYGMGNIGSVSKACRYFGANVDIATTPKKLNNADKIILPGVGAFGDAVAELRQKGLYDAIRKEILTGVPFLGICLGMHLLFEKSQEDKGVAGLGILKGSVIKFKGKGLKVPHMGWNNINAKCKTQNAKLLKNIPNNSYVYFCHSYYVMPSDKSIIAATTDYGGEFASVIAKNNIFGIQFHPEKSQAVGLKILENFIKL